MTFSVILFEKLLVVCQVVCPSFVVDNCVRLIDAACMGGQKQLTTNNGQRITAKESSDELHPPAVASDSLSASARRSRTPVDYLSLFVATWGVGYLPLAPGTWGSIVGVGIYLLLHRTSALMVAFAAQHAWPFPALEQFHVSLMLAAIIAISLAGIWAATRTEKLLGRKDPGIVVADEVAGQLMAFLFVPFVVAPWMIVAGFLAFRLFDIWKPYPIRRLEALESGLGIMADDLLAGAYAAALMSFAVTIQQLL